MSTDVKRVWGKADGLSLEFKYIGQEQWETSVPPDTKDGVYAVELWAVNGAGEIGHWTGELFMCSGVCCIKIFAKPYMVWFKKSKHQISFDKGLEVTIRKCESSKPYQVSIDKSLMIMFERRCSHVR